MSRTRIVGGKITEYVKGDYNIYSEGDIVYNSNSEINFTGEEKGVTYGEPETPPAPKIIPKCIVEFRPTKEWKGEFGFDWLRMGDTKTKGDSWYKNITGKYRNPSTKVLEQIYTGGNFFKDNTEYDKLLKKFKNMTIPWKPKIHGNPYLYPIPYMTIYKGKTCKLSLEIEIEELPTKLFLRHNTQINSKSKYFSFNRTEITIKKGKYKLNSFIEITCLESFKTDQIIEVVADDMICGKLIILANDKLNQKNAKVLFIRVISTSGSGSTAGEENRLKKYMNQAYINVDIKNLNLNLSKDPKFIPELKKNSATHQYLDNKLRKAKFPDGTLVGKKYDDFYRVYFISEIIKQSDGSFLLGQAQDIPSKTVYVLNLKDTAAAAGVDFESVKTTATHELLHAIGLFHTFDNNSPLTFKKFNTDNIMDYYSASTNIIAKQTYKWQWEILKNKV